MYEYMQRLESFSENYNARTISVLADYVRDHFRNYNDWKDSLKMINTRIKMLSVVGFFLIGAFFNTQFQKSQIKQATASVAKLSATQSLTTSSGTWTKVIDNDNKMPDDSLPKDTVNALFNAGYVSDKQVR